MTPPSPCPVCGGTTWMLSAWIDPRQATAKYPARPPVEPCVCVRARAHQQRLIDAGIPPEYQRCTLDNFRAYTGHLSDAQRFARAFTLRYPGKSDDPNHPAGLLFVGQPGVGKTHLAAATLTAIIADTGIRGLFCKTRDLLRRMRDSYNPAIQTTERQILDPILTCDLLVLDDLGVERMTDWVADTMDLIIDTRYSAGRPIIVTTNFPDVDDPEEKNGLWWRVGVRSRSRLHKMCQFLTLDGADYRDVSPEATDRDLQRLSTERLVALPGRTLSPGPRPTAKDGKGDLKWNGGRGGNI